MAMFIMLVGLPASGKSTLAETLSIKYAAEVLSSDRLRKEMHGDENIQADHKKLFEELNSRANTCLSKGKNVIYDSTNLNRKRRKHMIQHEIKADEKVVYYLNTHIDNCYERDKVRERTVGEEVINRMYKNLHIPVLKEGWKEVHTIYEPKRLFADHHKTALEEHLNSALSHDEFMDKLMQLIPEFQIINHLPHDSKYHSFSVSRHIFYVYKHIYEYYKGSNRLGLLYASIFHDLGKGFCKSFVNYKGEETRYASFIGHEYVSSQLAAFYLNQLGYSREFTEKVVTLVQFHMMPMNASEKKLSEIKELIGDTLFEDLLILHEADTAAK